jgi:hypothetical protein
MYHNQLIEVHVKTTLDAILFAPPPGHRRQERFGTPPSLPGPGISATAARLLTVTIINP